MVAVGEIAPKYHALTQDGAPFASDSLRGKRVVLYFYPKADTPGCTIEAKGFRDELPQYRAKGVEIVGVSTDDCPAQKAFATKYGLSFPLLADSKKEVATTFGVLRPTGTARRVTFLIEKDGKVAEVIDSSSVDDHLNRARARFLTG
ncbi:MAG: peroxiredoxin [Thermoplasmata archaeon]